MLSVAPKRRPDGGLQLHASTVVIDEKAVAFVGPSGCGKSGSALALMSRGARLLADDITWLHVADGQLSASCPATLSGRIEARGVGILNATPARPAPLCLIVDLGYVEEARLPPLRTTTLLGQIVRVLHRPATALFIDAIALYLTQCEFHQSTKGRDA